MRLIIDANVVLRTILGKRRSIARALEAGISLTIAEAQIVETAKVLVRQQSIPRSQAYDVINDITCSIEVLEMPGLYVAEAAARARLGPRGQSDWPVLAAALLFDADIWSDDRDLFGVGVAVWCKETIDIAIAQAAAK